MKGDHLTTVGLPFPARRADVTLPDAELLSVFGVGAIHRNLTLAMTLRSKVEKIA